ncbi:hypothetical protein VNI00_014175 [Paramarasmius palmivorus]|uniref:DRBM domain-containing protein n=1 Tax=Paramarasmius palmivorus TaxID=297713 RepID=A0AAW0BWK0_9AGAR
MLSSLHGLILRNTVTALSINPLNASGLPRRSPFNLEYQIPPVPCLCNPSLPNSVRYATLLFEEKNGYPLWCPEPNEDPSVPREHSETGIQIGDVGILHRDTPFDFLFNIACAADHPINQGGVPPGFTPLSLNNLSKTWHPHHRDYDSHVTAPKHTLMTSQVPKEELGSGINRMYTFTSSHQQGAILMLPEGSSLSKLESKAEFRKYAEQHARTWISWAQEHRGREYPSDIDPSIYLVTGWEKSTSWGTASFFNPSDSTTSLPFKVVEGANGSHEKYSWGHSSYCEARCHPNARHSEDGDRRLNQCVFLLGFKITTKRKNTQLKIRDLVDNKLEAGKVFDVPGGLASIGSSSVAASPSQGYNMSTGHLGGYSRASGIPHPSDIPVEDWQFPLTIDDTLSQHGPPFHLCDLINHFMLEVGRATGTSDDSVAISHDDEWIALVDDLRSTSPGHQSFKPFEFFLALAYRYTITVNSEHKSIRNIQMRTTGVWQAPENSEWQIALSGDNQTLPEVRVQEVSDRDPSRIGPSSTSQGWYTASQKEQHRPTKFITLLNNYFQGIGQDPTALSYDESCAGPSNKAIWSIHCKVNGVIKGTGRASTKAGAKEAAAKEAYESLLQLKTDDIEMFS